MHVVLHLLLPLLLNVSPLLLLHLSLLLLLQVSSTLFQLLLLLPLCKTLLMLEIESEE